ncbi:MAG: hypothetical protein PHN72_02465 [Bacilli bacterium]|nr:hypothetical protein [Bacilli bacterium]
MELLGTENIVQDIRELKPKIEKKLWLDIVETLRNSYTKRIDEKLYIKMDSFLYEITIGNPMIVGRKKDGKAVQIEECILIDGPNNYIQIAHREKSMPEITQSSFFRDDSSVIKRIAFFKNNKKAFDLNEEGELYTPSAKGPIKALDSYPPTWEYSSIVRAIALTHIIKKMMKKVEKETKEKEKQKQQGPTIIGF